MRQAWRCKEDTGGSGYYKEISAREHTRRRIRVNSQYSVALADGDTHNEADSGRGSGRQIDVMRVCRDAVTLFQGEGEKGRRRSVQAKNSTSDTARAEHTLEPRRDVLADQLDTLAARVCADAADVVVQFPSALEDVGREELGREFVLDQGRILEQGGNLNV